MIINLPTQQSLNDLALRTYFRAWNDLLEIWFDFSANFSGDYSDFSAVASVIQEWPDEWNEYTAKAQPDLQIICSQCQQAMELALKARICSVSPYLLLLNTNVKLSTVSGQTDFSELRTLDAVDLPKAVNTLTDVPVSDEFIEKYTALRSLRNKIIHLGDAGIVLRPAEVLRLAISLYIIIWADRRWLSDRLKFATQAREGWFHDEKNTSAHMEVLHEWPAAIKLLTKGEFKALFGHKKFTRRYLCHECVAAGETRYSGWDRSECGTAYLDRSSGSVGCIMCGLAFAIERWQCPECKGDVICAIGEEWGGHCHTCGADTQS